MKKGIYNACCVGSLAVPPSNLIQKQSHFSVKEVMSLSTPFLVRWLTSFPSLALATGCSQVFWKNKLLLPCQLGLDYVSHDDVLPYVATGPEPFKHELFNQFLLKSDSTEEGAEQYLL